LGDFFSVIFLQHLYLNSVLKRTKAIDLPFFRKKKERKEKALVNSRQNENNLFA